MRLAFLGFELDARRSPDTGRNFRDDAAMTDLGAMASLRDRESGYIRRDVSILGRPEGRRRTPALSQRNAP